MVEIVIPIEYIDTCAWWVSMFYLSEVSEALFDFLIEQRLVVFLKFGCHLESDVLHLQHKPFCVVAE